MTSNDAITLFDIVISYFPKTATRLDRAADKIHSLNFESAVAKIQDARERDLSEDKEESVSILAYKKPPNLLKDNNLRYAQRALKKRRSLGRSVGKKYMDTRLILLTSNICERFFHG